MFKFDMDAMHAKTLDKYDFTKSLEWCSESRWTEPCDIKQKICIDFFELGILMEDISDEELMRYLANKYPVVFDREITYKMRFSYEG